MNNHIVLKQVPQIDDVVLFDTIISISVWIYIQILLALLLLLLFSLLISILPIELFPWAKAAQPHLKSQLHCSSRTAEVHSGRALQCCIGFNCYHLLSFLRVNNEIFDALLMHVDKENQSTSQGQKCQIIWQMGFQNMHLAQFYLVFKEERLI